MLVLVNQGLSIEFSRQPPSSTNVIETLLKGEKSNFLGMEIQNLLSKRAIEIVQCSQKSQTTRFYSKGFSSAKTLRRLLYDLESQDSQQVCESKEFQDGVLKIDNACAARGALGLHDRPAGCLL